MKRFIDSNSAASTKSELDLFSIPATQVAIKRTFTDVIHTSNPVTNEGPYEFRIPADTNFVHLCKHYIYFQMRITKPDGTAFGANDPKIAPINLIGKTFFKQAKLYLNSKLIYDSGDNYHLRAYLETELNYGADAKSSFLSSALYKKESGAAATVNSENNPGFDERAALFGTSQWVEVMAPLHVDLMNQDRLLLPHTDLRIELHKNPDPLLLLCFHAQPPACRLEVREMKLFIQKVEVLESVQLALESTIAQYAAKYPIRRSIVTSLHVTQQRRVTPTNSIFQGQIPRRMIICCCDQDAYHGAVNKSPFLFQNYAIQSVKVTAGGQTFPAQPFRLDFTNHNFLQAYTQLFQALGLANDNRGNGITRTDFEASHCFFAFDLTADSDDGGHWDTIKEGTTSVEIQFGQNLPASGVQVIVYAEFDNLLSIDRNRVAHFDYTA